MKSSRGNLSIKQSTAPSAVAKRNTHNDAGHNHSGSMHLDRSRINGQQLSQIVAAYEALSQEERDAIEVAPIVEALVAAWMEEARDGGL